MIPDPAEHSHEHGAASQVRAGISPSAGGRQAPVPARPRQRLPLMAALLGCGALLLVSMILGVAVGSVRLSPAAVLQVIADHLEGHARYGVADAIVWDIRLPRVLLAAVVGATLTTAGTVVQVLVRNALADPFLLGVSSGASVGATAVLLFGAFASLILTTFDLDEYAFTALRAGASGFLLKSAPPEELLYAVRCVHNGDAVVAPSTTRRLIGRFMPHLLAAEGLPRDGPPAPAGLTAREREVLTEVGCGRSNTEPGIVRGRIYRQGMVFWQLTFDANDPGLLARFWAQALGYQPAPPADPKTTWQQHYRARLGEEAAFDDRLFDPAGLRPPIWFQQVPEAKAGKNRLHLDLYPTGRDNALPPERRIEIVEAKVAELVGLGAGVELRTRYDDPDDPVYYVVMHDPEGNEFCVG